MRSMGCSRHILGAWKLRISKSIGAQIRFMMHFLYLIMFYCSYLTFDMIDSLDYEIVLDVYERIFKHKLFLFTHFGAK